MGGEGALVAAADLLWHETALFAAGGFLILGLSDLAVDLVWMFATVRRRLMSGRGRESGTLADLPPPSEPGPIAMLVPAWDEAGVIGPMLRNTLKVWEGEDVTIFVGGYPNDPATAAEISEVKDRRLRPVTVGAPGPSTKADCLNRLWQAMVAEEAVQGRRFKAVLLHDAEDVVHPAELRIFDSLIERFDLVQLPVLPLIDENSRWIGGHYADEFAEAHGKGLVAREAIGAALPSAGVGCAIARGALDRLAERHGTPFDADSLTEDYELGLRLRSSGGRAAFVRLRTGDGQALVATREYFPRTLSAAVGQKARWMQGIALSGWDRLGWSGGFAERWMRMRDRQSLLAALLLLCGYCALLLWTLRAAASLAGLPPVRIAEPLQILLIANGALLIWRLVMRFAFVAAAYGWREGLRSLPRTLVANLIEMLAARRAVTDYLRGGTSPHWHKTAHAFPTQVPAE